MTVTSMVCTYLYGSLEILRGAIDGYQRAAKNLLRGIDKLVTAAMTVARYTIDVAVTNTINIVKVYEKQLFDMLYDAVFGSKKEIWCHRLWKCLALLNELLDPDSWLYRKLMDWWKKQCIDESMRNLLENMREVISDISNFQKVVCEAGFTVEFGISYIRQLLNWCKEQIEGYLDWCNRKIKEIKLALEKYLNTLIDWGVLDALEKLISFFTCVFDGKDSCAEMATADNYYKDAMAKMKLEKDGDGYNVSSDFRNSAYGGLVGLTNRLSNLKQDIDRASKMCVDPQKLKAANTAVNLSEQLLPLTDDGNPSWTNLRKGKFNKCKFARYASMTKDKLWDAISRAGDQNGWKADYCDIGKNTRITPDGTIYYKRGCDWVAIPYDEQPEIVNILASTDTDQGIMFKGHNVVTVTEAAYEIKIEPDTDFSKECYSLYSFINSWTSSGDFAKRFDESVI